MKPFVLLFTGISGSGKSTLANAVVKELQGKGISVDIIDGDDSRRLIGDLFGYCREERMRMGSVNRAIGYYLVKNGISVIYALVSPYEEIRKQFRDFFGSSYIEVYIKADRETCAKRDVKGLYRLSEQGMLSDFNGTNAAFETPEQSELIIDTDKLDINESKENVIEYLRKNKFIL